MRSSPRIRSREELQLLIEKWAESVISKQGSNPTVPVTTGRLDQRLAGGALACVEWLRKRRNRSTTRRANSKTMRSTNCVVLVEFAEDIHAGIGLWQECLGTWMTMHGRDLSGDSLVAATVFDCLERFKESCPSLFPQD